MIFRTNLGGRNIKDYLISKMVHYGVPASSENLPGTSKQGTDRPRCEQCVKRDTHCSPDPCGVQGQHRDNCSEASVRRGLTGIQRAQPSDHLSLQDQTQTKPNQSQHCWEKQERIQLFKNQDFELYRQLIWILTVGDSVWSLWPPLPLCSLASGQCLLNQSTLDRSLWNQNLLVVLWNEET